MLGQTYHFITRWRFEADADDVFRILDDAPALVRWWPAVYLEVEELEPGDANGIGKVVKLHTKGWLPYTLDWHFRALEKEPATRILLEAWGDFVGRGEWTLTQDGDFVDVVYDWRIRADKPLLRYFSFAMKPVFAANHRWAMAKGEESLRLELLRIQAATDAEREAVIPPPGPTTFSSSVFLAVCAAFVIGIGTAIYWLATH